MAIAPNKIPNDNSSRQFFAGVQTAQGTAATVSHRLNGRPRFNGLPPVTYDETATGTRFTMVEPTLGIPANDGSLEQSIAASYERLPSWLRMICNGGSTPSGGAGPDYTYTHALSPLDDNVDLETWIHGVPGMYERETDVRLTKLNIAADITGSDTYWQLTPDLMCGKWELLMAFEGVATGGTSSTITMTSAGWTASAFVGAWVYPHGDDNRTGAYRINANTTTMLTIDGAFGTTPTAGDKFLISFLPPAGIPALVEEKIKAGGTKLYIDQGATAIGTTQILKRFRSFNVTMEAVGIDNKVFMENEFDRSGVYGFDRWDITGQVRLEFDRPDEIRQLLATRDLKMRIEKLGSLLGPGVPKMARIDLLDLNWITQARDNVNSNLTQTLAFRAAAQVTPITWSTRNGLATLPN